MQEAFSASRFWLPQALDRKEFAQEFKVQFPEGTLVYVNVGPMPSKIRLLFHPEISPVRKKELELRLRPPCFVFDLVVPESQEPVLAGFLMFYPTLYNTRGFQQRLPHSSSVSQITLR